jgi:hypothetical protein
MPEGRNIECPALGIRLHNGHETLLQMNVGPRRRNSSKLVRDLHEDGGIQGVPGQSSALGPSQIKALLANLELPVSIQTQFLFKLLHNVRRADQPDAPRRLNLPVIYKDKL